MDETKLKNIIEAAVFATDEAVNTDKLLQLFEAQDEQPDKQAIKDVLKSIEQDYQDRVMVLQETASGYRFQVKQEYAVWIRHLWDEKPPRYSRALLETLVLIAYRQPITRAEIEDVRGVSVSSSIIKTLLEREWIRIVGHRELPGKPALFATTRQFLDYFNLKSLEELPTLMELQDLNTEISVVEQQLALELTDSDNQLLDQAQEELMDAESRVEAIMEQNHQCTTMTDDAKSEYDQSQSDEPDDCGQIRGIEVSESERVQPLEVEVTTGEETEESTSEI